MVLPIPTTSSPPRRLAWRPVHTQGPVFIAKAGDPAAIIGMTEIGRARENVFKKGIWYNDSEIVNNRFVCEHRCFTGNRFLGGNDSVT